MKAKSKFAFLPRDILWQPPIRLQEKGKWRPLDAAIACAILIEARLALDKDHRRQAHEAAGARINRKKAINEKRRLAWTEWKAARHRREAGPAPTKRYQPHLAPFLQSIGKAEYKRSLEELRKTPPPDVILVETSKFALLQRAGAYADNKNMRLMEDILTRLARPVLVGKDTKAPLLRCSLVSPRRLSLHVAGKWLEPSFGKVYLPLPTHSAPGLALWLFLSTIRKSNINKEAISTKALCQKIGIDPGLQRWQWSRQLSRAIDIVNDNLGRVRSYRVPGQYKMHLLDQGQRVRFEAIARQQPDPEARPISKPIVLRQRVPTSTRLARIEQEDQRYARQQAHRQERRLRGFAEVSGEI